jgi:hypothetical protein
MRMVPLLLNGVTARGSSDNQFDRPEDIVLSPFGIFVADTGNDRIMKFNNNFEFC